MLRKFLSFTFGQVSVEEIFKAIFAIGLLPIPVICLLLPTRFGINSIFPLSFRSSFEILVSGFVILFFILVTVVIWKLFCELLFLIFKSLEIYIMKNK